MLFCLKSLFSRTCQWHYMRIYYTLIMSNKGIFFSVKLFQASSYFHSAGKRDVPGGGKWYWVPSANAVPLSSCSGFQEMGVRWHEIVSGWVSNSLSLSLSHTHTHTHTHTRDRVVTALELFFCGVYGWPRRYWVGQSCSSVQSEIKTILPFQFFMLKL